MENQLSLRDKVGLQDFLLLENYQDEDAFIENLRKRFYEKIIYTYIGQVLVSVNPCTFVDIYNENYIRQYQNVNFYEMPPHIFAMADQMYRIMKQENRDQCCLISGESGSGKTEASKKVLLHLSAISKSSRINKIKDKLLNSNPVLESFGNAKTSINENSSRFGKYMDIEFDYTGQPIGGKINNYLLEKSRVVHQNEGDQNFHIFYQLISGLDELTLQKLQLRRDPSVYYYLNQGETSADYNIEDSKQFLVVKNALKVFDFSDEEEESIYKIIASIIHMGQIGFFEEDGQAVIAQYKPIQIIAKLIDCNEDDLKQAFTNKSFEVRQENVTSPLTRDQAIYVRDALAKSLYERLFKWLIKKLNDSLLNKNYTEKKNVIGLLDIYGFEINAKNTFEQFNINYCNEKLQQLFIELTLRSEQEEYRREEIEWQSVDYFDNKIICDLIEEKHKGIISILDEECLRPGDSSDITFLNKLTDVLGKHPHFATHQSADSKWKKKLQHEDFYINHYAGDVVYNTNSFLDKNNDLLYRDLKKAMCNSRNSVVQTLFPFGELNEKKRPPTVVNQFKNSLNELMQLLKSKDPWYIRCIKPHENKRVVQFSNQTVRHQVKYLGLMENLRVRRAGFAYRRDYEYFLARYKSLCEHTWPNYRGNAKEGVELLIKKFNFKPDDYSFGKTKIFIKLPRSLFYIEDLYQARKLELVVFLQKNIRMFIARNKYVRAREAVTKIASYYKMYKAKQELKQRRWAAAKIRSFIKGFITRNDEPNEHNKQFINNVKIEWLKRLAKNCPKLLIDKSWPVSPKICEEASDLLKVLHRRCLVRSYVSKMTPKKKQLMEEKVLIENLFRFRKENYSSLVSRLFMQFRDLNEDELKYFEKNIKQFDEKIVYASQVTKIDRHGYKPRKRILVITNLNIYLLDEKANKVKDKISIESISKLFVSSFSDGFLIIAFSNDMKLDKGGDLIIDLNENIFETIVGLSKVCDNIERKLQIESNSIKHTMNDGHIGVISFKKGKANEMFKNKDGILQVISV